MLLFEEWHMTVMEWLKCNKRKCQFTTFSDLELTSLCSLSLGLISLIPRIKSSHKSKDKRHLWVDCLSPELIFLILFCSHLSFIRIHIFSFQITLWKEQFYLCKISHIWPEQCFMGLSFGLMNSYVLRSTYLCHDVPYYQFHYKCIN